MFKCKGKGKGSKRVLAIALFLGLVLVASSVYAEGPSRFSNSQNVKMYVVENTTVSVQNTAISTTYIDPLYHRILGYEVTPISSGSKENYVVLADCAGITTMTTALVFGESEAATGSSISRWFPYPKSITTGVLVRQGGLTYVTVYYEDKREI